jgi:eukaryotic-like serine/threonine-protein kinase
VVAAPGILELGEDAGLEVLGELGQGDQAVVYRARRQGTEYAVKVLRRDATRHPDVVRDFHRQAALLACADDPGLPRVHAAGTTTGGSPYVVMDFIPGDRLDSRIAAGRFAEAAAIRLATDLAAALGAAHRVNLVHRDVKPENILVTPAGGGRLVDFGLATRLVGNEADGPAEAIAGTMIYSPPEQTGMLNRPVDARSDLYALGVVLFECVTGRPPYASSDVGELLRLHAVAPVPDPRETAPELSETFAGILRKLLAKDPDDRYQSAPGLVADLHRLADGDGGFALGADDRAATLAEIPLTGRDEELARLRARWDAAREGTGGLVVLRGDNGSGKTRLAIELSGIAEADGAAVLRGAAVPGDHRPLAGIRAAVEDYLRGGEPALTRVRKAAGSGAALLQQLSPAMRAPQAADQASREQFAAAVAGLLTGLTQDGPVLLHLDDAQFFDATTERVLARLTTGLADVPLLVVVTAPTGFDGADTEIEPDFEFELSPLPPTEVDDLLHALGRGMRFDTTTAARVAMLSGGNPFTVIEYAGAMFDNGLLRPYWGTWRSDEAGLRDLALPEDAAQLMLRKADRLDPEAQLVLRTAAITGAKFPAALVARVAGTPERQVLDVLAEAARIGLVEVAGDDRFVFRHDSIRESFAATVPAGERRRMHDRIADLMGRCTHPVDEYALVEHCLAGEPGHDPARLVRAARAAGERALSEYAPQIALNYLETARDVAAEYALPLDPGFDRLLGVAYHRNGRFAEALDALHTSLGRTVGRHPRAHVYRLIAEVQESAGLGEELYETAVQGLAALGRPLPSGRAHRLVKTLAIGAAGMAVRTTRLGRGTARDHTRDVLRTQSALYYYAGSGAVRALRPIYSLIFAVLQTWPVSRLGADSQRVRSLASVSVPMRMLGLHGVADRMVRNALGEAAALGDQAALTWIEWIDGVGKHASGADDGRQLAELLAERRDLIDTGLALDAYATVMWDQVLRGDTGAAERLAGRRRHFLERGGHDSRSSVVAADAFLLALEGRAGDAASLIERFGDDEKSPVHERMDLLVARMQGAYERDDLDVLDELAATFDGFGLRWFDLLPTQAAYFVWLSYGRLERARRATGDTRAAEIKAARAAIASLRKLTKRTILRGHHAIACAFLAYVEGKPESALEKLAAAEKDLRRLDAPAPAYEKALLTARSLTAMGVTGEAGRQARLALSIASENGWLPRARRVAAEFALGSTGGLPQAAGDRRSAALEQVTLAASRILDPVKLTRIALDETVRLLGAERAVLFLVDPSSETLAPYASSGSELGDLSGYSATVVHRVRASREPLVVTGTDEGEAMGARSVVTFGLRSILAAPLLLDERLLGVVYLDSRVAKGVFTVDDVDLLAAVTHHIAVALETARAAQLELAVATANRQRDLAETLRAAMARFSKVLDPATVLRELLSISLLTPGGDQGWVLLGSRGDRAVSVMDGPVLPASPALESLLGIRAPQIGGGAWTRLLLDADAAGGSTGSSATPASWLVMPLETRDGPAGVLVLAATAAGAWTDADLGVVAALASQAMVAYENARLFSQVNEMATTDSLTGVANRRRFFELARSAFSSGEVLSALMIDIDHFKKINDTYGHQVGDDVISGVVARLVSRTSGIVGRYGGEEFALLLPGVSSSAFDVGEALRAAVAESPIDTRSGPVTVTISVGVAVRRDTDESPDTLLGRADAGLYAAKQGGRNRVVGHQP